MKMTLKTSNADRLSMRPRATLKAILAGIFRRMIKAYRAWREQRRAAAECRSWSVNEFEDTGVKIRRGGRPTVSEYLRAIDDSNKPIWPRLYRNH